MSFFGTNHGKSPCNEISGAVKHTAKKSLQSPLNDQIFDYESMFTLQEEMPSIQFFDISKETMTDVRHLQKQFRNGKTIPSTRSSDQFTVITIPN